MHFFSYDHDPTALAEQNTLNEKYKNQRRSSAPGQLITRRFGGQSNVENKNLRPDPVRVNTARGLNDDFRRKLAALVGGNKGTKGGSKGGAEANQAKGKGKNPDKGKQGKIKIAPPTGLAGLFGKRPDAVTRSIKMTAVAEMKEKVAALATTIKELVSTKTDMELEEKAAALAKTMEELQLTHKVLQDWALEFKH